jgi:hypothetical protein
MNDAAPVTGHQSPDTALMSHIKGQWGAGISQICKSSPIPEAFVAALVANESGGKPDAKRFEHGVLASLWDVLAGRNAAYGSLGADDISRFILAGATGAAAGGIRAIFTAALQQLDGLATSWGLTQVMGYEAIVFGMPLSDLAVPAKCLGVTLRMLTVIAHSRHLDVMNDFPQLFDCWNTGRPHAPTADPQYIPNGLARMKIYAELEPPKAISA